MSNNRGISEIAGEIMGEIGGDGEIREIGEHGGLARRGNDNARRSATGWSLSDVVGRVSWSDRGISRRGAAGRLHDGEIPLVARVEQKVLARGATESSHRAPIPAVDC